MKKDLRAHINPYKIKGLNQEKEIKNFGDTNFIQDKLFKQEISLFK